MASEFEMASCIRVYCNIWNPVLGECGKEPTNSQDRYAVVIEDWSDSGHLPRRTSLTRVCSLFLRRGGEIIFTVIGGHWYSSDLEQGGWKCHVCWKAEREREEQNSHVRDG